MFYSAESFGMGSSFEAFDNSNEIEHLQNILAEDFEVEFIDYNKETFPKPIQNENDLIKIEPENVNQDVSVHPLFGNVEFTQVKLK